MPKRVSLNRGEKSIDWGLIFRRCERELRMRKWEIGRYTLSQLVNALDRSDPSDPHAGGIPITSLSEIDEMVEAGLI